MLEHGPVPHQEFIDEEVGSAVLKTLEEKGWIESVEKNQSVMHGQRISKQPKDKTKANAEQKAIAIATVNSQTDFGCFLLKVLHWFR